MKKFYLILAALLLLPLAQACICLDLFSLSTGIEPLREDFTGGWHSDEACSESDEEPYQWGITLVEDDEGNITGTLYFHDCPGGNAVTYALAGRHEEGQSVAYLTGTRTGGRHTLFGNSPPEQLFEIMYGGPPYPNFVD